MTTPTSKSKPSQAVTPKQSYRPQQDLTANQQHSRNSANSCESDDESDESNLSAKIEAHNQAATTGHNSRSHLKNHQGTGGAAGDRRGSSREEFSGSGSEEGEEEDS